MPNVNRLSIDPQEVPAEQSPGWMLNLQLCNPEDVRDEGFSGSMLNSQVYSPEDLRAEGPPDPMLGLLVHSARAKESHELAEETELLVLSDLADKLNRLLNKGITSSTIMEALNYLRWRTKRIKGVRREPEHTGGELQEKHLDSSTSHAVGDTVDNRQAFLRDRDLLLSQYLDMFVAYANGQLVEADASFEALVARLEKRPECSVVYLELVDEAAFGQQPVFEMPGVYDILPTGDTRR